MVCLCISTYFGVDCVSVREQAAKEEVMTVDEDPLEALVVNQNEVDRAALARGLAPFIGIDRDSRTYAFRPGVRERLDNRQRVVASLLARKAMGLLMPDYVEPASPKVLERETGVGGGTLRPILKDLATRRLVEKNADGYRVATYAVDSAIASVRNDD
jgi:hypothetical protein